MILAVRLLSKLCKLAGIVALTLNQTGHVSFSRSWYFIVLLPTGFLIDWLIKVKLSYREPVAVLQPEDLSELLGEGSVTIDGILVMVDWESGRRIA